MEEAGRRRRHGADTENIRVGNRRQPKETLYR